MTDGEARWLTDEEREAWISLIGILAWLPADLDTQLQRDAGLSMAEYQVLSWLSMSPDRTSRMTAISEMSNLRLSHLSRVVGRLEARGWVERRPDPSDGRATLASLTEAGWEKVVATAPGHVQQVRQAVFDRLTPAQVGQLGRIGGAILTGLKPECSAANRPERQPES